MFVLAMSITMAAAGVREGTTDTAVIKFIRSFYDEDASAPKRNQVSVLSELNRAHFQPKDIWGNRDYVFGYGSMGDGSTILFAWKNSEDAPSIDLKDLASIYQDDRMASIKDEGDMKRWKKMREVVSGAFIGVRKSESRYGSIYPASQGDRTGRDSLLGLVLDRGPVVVRFTSITSKPKNLLISLDRVPTR